MSIQPPDIPVFPAGYAPLGTDMDNWVQTPFTFLTTGIMFRAERAASQSISATTFTVVQYDTVLEDPYGGWNSGSHEWVAPADGWYEITVTSMVSAVNGVLIGAIAITGTNPTYESTEIPIFTSAFGGGSAQALVYLVGGVDNVQGSVWCSVAATTPTTNEGRFPSMQISYVSQ